ncbi:MAG: RNHCP domain-containing protein [Pseudomonadota bacterium]
MKSAKFTAINESFTCEYCGLAIRALKTGCRNHCPGCLSSKHVDVFPGDRASDCHGLLKAYGYEMSAKKGIVLLFRCTRCGFTGKNKATLNDPLQPDSLDAILKLTRTS